MPTYEFVCKKCGKNFSLFTSIAGRSKACCPSCNSNELQQIYKGMMFVKSAGGGYTGGCSGNCSGCSGC